MALRVMKTCIKEGSSEYGGITDDAHVHMSAQFALCGFAFACVAVVGVIMASFETGVIMWVVCSIVLAAAICLSISLFIESAAQCACCRRRAPSPLDTEAAAGDIALLSSAYVPEPDAPLAAGRHSSDSSKAAENIGTRSSASDAAAAAASAVLSNK